MARKPIIDTSVAHNARVWDYWLGGRDNYAVDREMGEMVMRMYPEIIQVARADRYFLARAIRFIADERPAGRKVRQFLDIGTGLPTVDNTHEVAQRIDRTARVVYVDNDPLVLAHARALLNSTPEGVTAYVDADARDTSKIILEAGRTLDLSRPTAVMMLGILNFILDDEQAYAVVRHLMDAMPSGSLLVLTHPTLEYGGEANTKAMEYFNAHAEPPLKARDRDQVMRFFEGLELIEPGLVSCPQWRPELTDLPPGDEPALVAQYGAVARKP